jgi:LAO/AO transport system kinase
MGDDIQAIKAGIMEIGDVFVINKADHEGVSRTEKELEALLSLAMRPDAWQPPIIKTIATENKGIEELAAAIAHYHEFQVNATASEERRQAIARWRILELLRERLLTQILRSDSASSKLDALTIEVAAKRRDPYSVVEEIINEKSGAGSQNSE